MKSFFLKLLIFNLIILINIIIISILPVPYSKNSETYDCALSLMYNKDDLLKKIDKNKIIIVGGSGVYYSINCKRIQNEINIPVINQGLFIGLGLNYMLEEFSSNINKGDIIIIIPEYAILSCDYAFYPKDEQVLKWILIKDPLKSIKYFYYSKKMNILIIKYFEYIQDKCENIHLIFKRILLSDFNLKKYSGYGNYDYDLYINENGDRNVLYDHLMLEKLTHAIGVFNEKPQEEAIKILNNFYLMASKKGAKVYLYFSCYPKSEIINKNEKQLKNYYETLSRELNFKVLCKPERTIFDDEYFLDTVNHLNSRGREIMTTRLIEDLKEYVIRDNK